METQLQSHILHCSCKSVNYLWTYICNLHTQLFKTLKRECLTLI